MSRRLAWLPLAALLICLLSVSGGGAPAGAAGTVPTTGALRICSGCDSSGLGDGSRYSYVVLHSWQAGLIPRLKAANPALKLLVYKDMAATVSYACQDGRDDTFLPAGVGYCWAGANRPEWFLTDESGQRIEFCDFSGAWQMDVGSPGYQQRWAANVTADLRAGGWDGVMVDDANQSERWHLCGRTIARYPTDAEYTAATERFLAAVGPALTSQGFLVLPNISIDEWWATSGLAVWDRWVSHTSGAVLEYFSKWGHGTGRWFTDDGAAHNNWTARQDLLVRTQRAGKVFLGITYAPSDDTRSMRYARASFLADWSGGASALLFQPTTPEQQDPYFSDWTVDVGTPVSARTKVGVAWLRRFSGGVVVVNPSPGTPQPVDLGGAYLFADGTQVRSVTVAPTDGLVLRAASAPATATAAAPVKPPKGKPSAGPKSVPRPDAASRRVVVGRGAIRVRTAAVARFSVTLRNGVRRIRFTDSRTGLSFRATRTDAVRIGLETFVVRGRGLLNGRLTRFMVSASDGGRAGNRDVFRISLGTGYRTAGRLVSGDLHVGAASSR